MPAVATAGLSAGLSYGILTGSVSTQVPKLLGAAAARLPATMALAAVAVLLFGLLPWESTGLAWSAVALAGVITVFGPPLQWPAWTMDISPFTQTPKLPGGTVPAEPLLWLCGITLALAHTAWLTCGTRTSATSAPPACPASSATGSPAIQLKTNYPLSRSTCHGTATRNNRPGHATTAAAPGAQNRLICADERAPAKPREFTPVPPIGTASGHDADIPADP